MKNLFLFLLLIGFFFKAQSQELKPVLSVHEELVKKTDSQFKTGMILIGAGSAMALTAMALPSASNDYYGSRSNTAKRILGWTGFLSISTSIPFFLASGRNGRTAAKISLQSQLLDSKIPVSIRSYPSFALKIPL
jgi:hypothetical protein